MSMSSNRSVTSSLRKSVSSTSSRRLTNGSFKKIISFNLPHNQRIRTILQNFLNRDNIKEYEQLTCAIRDDLLSEAELLLLLEEASQCVSLLKEDLRHFVEAILVLNWIKKSPAVIKKYQSFLVNLLSAHIYHAKFAIDNLIIKFIPEEREEWPNGVPNDEDCQKLANVHSVINILLKIIPMSQDILRDSVISLFPYFKQPTHTYEFYIHNLFWLLDYQPKFKMDFLYLLFKKLIILDVNAPREEILIKEKGEIEDEIFSMEDCKQENITINPENMQHPIAHTLDVCLDKLFNFIVIECYNFDSMNLDLEKTKEFYQKMLLVFERLILPTYNIHHVQFVMFFLCSFNSSLCENFLNYLWKKVCDPNVPPVHRLTAVTYIASLLARGNFVTVSSLKSVIQELSLWIHSYIQTQDGLECINSDVRVHAVFYGVCQALFYIIAFRYRELVNTRKNIAFLENLNIAKMVTCRLNPLRACQPAVVQNFAAVMRTYQLAYCYTIIEHNSRSSLPTIYVDEKGCITLSTQVLDSFFPFDPFLLKRSGKKIASIYIEYKDTENTKKNNDDEDDFLENSFDDQKSKHRRFSYGTSPGFKYKS